MFRFLMIFFVSMTLSNASYAEPKSPHPKAVVVLHGIAEPAAKMLPLVKKLERHGYRVFNLGYKSTRQSVAASANDIQDKMMHQNIWAQSKTVHFVTHSMGGLVVRDLLQRYKTKIPTHKLGRVVMLAPPNKGSEVADLLENIPPYKALYGPAGQELTTTAQKSQQDIIPTYDLGIIAGSKGWPYVFANLVIPGKNDGRVTVKNTKLKGMTDHITVPATHSFIAWKPSVHRQILYFLEHGSFNHAK